ncbi:MAG: hypothetical protein WD533_06935 [Dehalococcoidia bacterium]
MATAEEKQSWFDRGIEAAKLMQGPLTSAGEAVSGKAVQREVSEYTEVFTQVALGLHEDVTAAQRNVRVLFVISLLALAVGLAALGVALWTLYS